MKVKNYKEEYTFFYFDVLITEMELRCFKESLRLILLNVDEDEIEKIVGCEDKKELKYFFDIIKIDIDDSIVELSEGQITLYYYSLKYIINNNILQMKLIEAVNNLNNTEINRIFLELKQIIIKYMNELYKDNL